MGNINVRSDDEPVEQPANTDPVNPVADEVTEPAASESETAEPTETETPPDTIEEPAEPETAEPVETPAAVPEPGAAPEPVVTKEIEKQTIVKEAADKKSPEPTEKVVERVVEVPAASPVPAPTVAPEQKPRRSKAPWLILVLVLLLAAATAAWWYVNYHNNQQTATNTTKTVAKPKTPLTKVHGLQLDPNKNYGNKYADGILPVGDGKYSTTAAKQGYVYACSQYARNLTSNTGGAGTRGPWFVSNDTEYDTTKKVHVLGSVTWHPQMSNTVTNGERVIMTNDLPNHTTGVFPIASTDPAYSYDRNPNSISSQSLTYTLSSNPTYNDTPNCMGGESGVMLTGVALFNAFDAGGRDAGAWEVQDNCAGHPEKEGEYHYHTLSGCIQNISVQNVIGYALDGFPITGPQVGTNNILTTSDLDECHGITSQITLDGKSVTMYHYVMTQDFPYSVSCFRGQPINPPGQQAAAKPPTAQ